MATSLRLVPPPRLKNFVLTEKLGQGTYATVYKAFRKRDTRDVVAIKCIQKGSLSKTATENLITEIELLKKLNHDHIVQLKDFEWDDQFIFLIMEYCSGGDLSRFIQSRRALPEEVARKFLRQLALALEFLHSEHIAHMDLKPQNLLLSSKDDPVLKVADFGFAQYLHRDSGEQAIRGSPLYMAPEMICTAKYDAAVDLWSVGVILYETVFGAAPFASKSFAELEGKIRSTDPVELPPSVSISFDCRDLLLRLLQRNPKDRISFEDFFGHPFIDLEHVPSPKCLQKAIRLVTEAVKKDQLGLYKDAAQLYCRALDYFLPAVTFEKDRILKSQLRERVVEYMQRAEELKENLKARNRDRTPGLPTSSPDEVLAGFSRDNQELKAALRLAEVAEIRDEHEAFESALEQYQVALGSLLPILAATPAGKLKEALHAETSRYMRRAEELKTYLKLGKERARVSRMAEDDQQSRCVIQ